MGAGVLVAFWLELSRLVKSGIKVTLPIRLFRVLATGARENFASGPSGRPRWEIKKICLAP